MQIDQFLSVKDSTSLSDKFYGIIPAIVTNNIDKEKLDRIEVTFEFSTNKKHIVSSWAKVSTFLTGKEFGSSFIPAVQSEVLVTFIAGNIGNPCVIGMLRNGKDKPPKEAKDNPKVNIIQSEYGGALIFDNEKKIVGLKDEKSKMKVLLNTSSKTVEIETTDGVITITCGKDIIIKTDANLKVTGKDISIEGSGNLSLVGQKVSIEAKSDLDLTGVNISSTAQGEHKISGKIASLEGKVTTNIKGGMINMN